MQSALETSHPRQNKSIDASYGEKVFRIPGCSESIDAIKFNRLDVEVTKAFLEQKRIGKLHFLTPNYLVHMFNAKNMHCRSNKGFQQEIYPKSLLIL